ncbi:CheR family methyltransferase [Sphingomonas sp. ac-8]|uniref:CheR family methyltransferase n=1 Tax=Sphingomonas sp. ac-8 TaxID=3242977 RepID=UPI003A806D1B
MLDTDEQVKTPATLREEEDRAAVMPVVGVGVCAASLRSLETLFSGIGPTLGAAYLVAVRQQEGLDVRTTVEALTRVSPLPVGIGRDGEAIEADRIYVGGSDDMIAIEDGHLSVQPAAEPVGHRGTIDTMLISLAEHAHDRSVAVLLGGLGSDGTAGVTATKKFGGLSIAEARTQDDDNGAQGVAGPFGVVDMHVAIDRIATQIALYLRNLHEIGGTFQEDGEPDEVEAQVTQITTILRNTISHDFHGYKRGTFLRRVHRRMQVLQIDTLDAYVARLRDDRQEVQDLFQDLLIGVTQFFRDPLEFEVLERELPRLFEGKGPDDQFRVWVLGCATGEEAYSMAILLREQMARMDHPPHVQIFATDLDARALGLARAGRYATSIEDHVRPDRLERWFVREGETYCVSKELREMCIFSPHNLIKDAPFSRVDLLSCRNLLIYLNAELQNRVIPIFHFSLVSGGVLFLGNSENVTRHQKLFAAVDRKNRVFRRLETATRVIPEFPLSPRARTVEPLSSLPAETGSPARLSATVSRQAEAIAERYAPAYVVVDTQGDVLHFSGRTGRFLEPIAGVASLNVFNLVHRDLRVDLRSALHRAISEARRVELPRLVLQQEDRATGINLVVEPVGSNDVTSLIVLFQDLGTVAEGASSGDRLDGGERVERLEAELRLTRDRLQTTIEELESTNEELKSSNEEYQSINEELQSANEEMETSKEELQSVNEELQTVNGELAHRVAELGRSNSDLKNLLEATQIATLFLDNDLRVRSFTPSATEIFHLLETDVGRPLDHVVSRVAYPELQDDVRRVLKALAPVERMVIDPLTQRHFAARVLPYRSVDNYIGGAVVTFTDLTAVHQAEAALRESEARLQALLAAGSEVAYRMSPDWSEMIDLSGGGFLSDTKESTAWEAQHIPEVERARVEAAIARAIREKSTFELEHRVIRIDGTVGWTLSRAVPITGSDGQILEWFGAASDVTARHEAEDALRESQERLRSLVEGLTQLVWRAVDSGHWTWASRQWRDYTGQSEADSEGWGWLDPVHPDDRPIAREAWRRAAEQGGFEIEVRILRAADGTYRWFQIRTAPVVDDGGQIVEWVGTSTDIDDLRDLQERQGVLVAELQHRTRNLMGVVRQMTQKTMRASTDLDDFRDRFSDRLDALARVQGLLSRLGEHDRVTFDELIRTELAAHGAEPSDDGRITIAGPAAVRLRSTTVQTLAMALHELATNAVKYGALGQSEACLTVEWHMADGDGNGSGNGQPWLYVDWRESGVAMPPAGATAQGGGQGRELIERALPYQLAAKTTYVLEEDGVHCTIAMPVSTTNTSREHDDG